MMPASGRVVRHFLAPLVLVALAVLMIAHPARADDAVLSWDSLLDEQKGDLVHFGVRLGGRLPFERNSSEAFVPASVTKLFTAGMALDRLGADYRFETAVRWRSLSDEENARIADLIVVGSGDPTWGVARFETGLRARLDQIAGQLFKSGVREIHGAIRFVAADSRWDDVTAPPGWTAADQLTCDGALPHAFNLSLNCATLVISDLTHAHWREEGVPTPVQLSLAAGAKTSVRAEVSGAGYRVSGTLAADSEPLTTYLPIADTAGWALGLFRGALVAAGIRVLESQPEDSVLVTPQSFSVQSPPLREILKPFLKNSINLIGQGLFLAAGGESALRDYLDARLPAEQVAEVELHDGNGMSYSNLVTPRALFSFLDVISRGADFPVVWDALAIAGVDGTLASRMRGTAAEGVVRAKTGTLTSAYNLAGYVPTYNAAGQAVAFAPFVVLAHAAADLEGAAHAAQDRVAARLAASANR
jgi:D-alanyl-D-alanine carboxypeptidase/D-alanyl-D-alanine-endopeptidase (penicillin-binding protein 4)